MKNKILLPSIILSLSILIASGVFFLSSQIIGDKIDDVSRALKNNSIADAIDRIDIPETYVPDSLDITIDPSGIDFPVSVSGYIDEY